MKFRQSIFINNLVPPTIFAILIIIVLIFLRSFSSKLEHIAEQDFLVTINSLSMLDELGSMHSNLSEFINGKIEEKAEFDLHYSNFKKFHSEIIEVTDKEKFFSIDSIQSLINTYSNTAYNIFNNYNPEQEKWAKEKYNYIEANYGKILSIKLDTYKEKEIDDANKVTEIKQLLSDDLPGVRYYLEIHEETGDLLRGISRYVGGNPQAKVDYLTDFEQFGHYFERLSAIEQKPDEQKAMREIKYYITKIDESAREIFETYDPAQKISTLQQIDDIEHNYLAKLKMLLNNTVNERRENTSQEAITLQRRVMNVNIWSIIVLIFGFITTLFLSVFLARNLYNKLGADPNDLVLLTDITDYEQLKPLETKNKHGLNKAISEMINRLQISLSSILYNSTVSESLSDLSKEFVGKENWKKSLEFLALKLQETFDIEKVVVITNSSDDTASFNLDYAYPSDLNNSIDINNFTRDEITIRLKNKRELTHLNLSDYDFNISDNKQAYMLPISYDNDLNGILYVERKSKKKNWLKFEAESLVIIAEIIGQSLGRIKSNEALKISGDNYRSIFNNSYDAILLCEKNGNVIEANTAFRKLIDDTVSPEINYNIYSFFNQQKLASFREWFEDIPIRTEDLSLEMNIISQQNNERILQMSGHIIQYSGQEIIILFINDITDHKLREKEVKEFNRTLEQRIQERTKQLEASNAELESFSYSVSHDLRAPLRAIVGFSSIIKEDYLEKVDEEGKKYFDNIMRNSERMGILIDEILAFSRLHRSSINKQEVNLSQLVNKELEAYGNENKITKLTYKVEDVPMAQGAPELIKQVVHNLVSNAIKYSSKEDKPLIEFGSTSENNEIVYYIRDNGVGFNSKYKSKLFGVFQRLHSANEFEGTGVGLAFVQRILFKHGGRIWADGEINQGATFYFTLPNK